MKYTTDNLPEWQGKIETGHSIKAVFATIDIHGAIIHTYYDLRDVFNTFVIRAMEGIGVYEEFNSRMTPERNKEFAQAIRENALSKNDPSVHIDLANKLEERIDWPIPPRELIKKMAAVAYFDETESPYHYDETYQREFKLPHWIEHGVDDFFLGNNLSGIVPFPNISQEDFEAVLRVMTAQDQLLGKKYANILPNAFPSLRSEVS